MSTFFRTTKTCCVCGKESEHTLIGSTNSFGSPDLDFRPSGMARATMSMWLQECPHCGYVAFNLSDPLGTDANILRSERYVNTDDRYFGSALARRFYRHYILACAESDAKTAFNSALRAAWACDDEDDEDNAVFCRMAALAQYDGMISAAESDDPDDVESLRVLKMDLLRRAGQFDRLASEYADVVFSSEVLNKIKAFQLTRARCGDTRYYTVADCTDERF